MSDIDYTRILPAIQSGVQGLAQVGSSMNQPPAAQPATPALSLSSEGIPERPTRQGTRIPLNPNQRALADLGQAADREMARLNRRKQVFTLRNQITEQMRYQEQLEADLTLSPLVADLGKYASSGNWAGLYAKRKEIIENPLYFQSRDVAQQVARLDAQLARYGTEVTTDGREVNFNDVTRMVGSGDPEMQKEGLRILALRSENGLEFVQNLPLTGEAAKDPMFRFHLRTFIKDNPRIDRNDYELYESAKKFYFDGIKQQYKNDPKMASAMLSSPQTQEELKALRESLLRNKNTRTYEWAPPSSTEDQRIDDSDLNLLSELVSQQIYDSGSGFFRRLASGFGRGPVVRGKAAGTEALQQLRQPQGTTVPGQPGTQPVNPAARENRVGLPTGSSALLGGAVGGAGGAGVASLIGRSALKGGGVAGLAGAAIAGVTDMAMESREAQRVIRKEQAKASRAFNEVSQYRNLIAAEVGKGEALNEEALSVYYNKMANAIESLNVQMAGVGMEHQLSPLNLFTRRQFQIISSKISRQQAARAARLGLSAGGNMGLMMAPQQRMMGGMMQSGAGTNPLLSLGATPVATAPAE